MRMWEHTHHAAGSATISQQEGGPGFEVSCRVPWDRTANPPREWVCRTVIGRTPIAAPTLADAQALADTFFRDHGHTCTGDCGRWTEAAAV